MKFEWEILDETRRTDTIWAKVFGGWLVRYVFLEDSHESATSCMVFVPDANHEWTIDE